MRPLIIIVALFFSLNTFSQKKVEPIFVKASIDTVSITSLQEFLKKAFNVLYFKYFEKACGRDSLTFSFQLDSFGRVTNIRHTGSISALSTFITDALKLTNGGGKQLNLPTKEIVFPVFFAFTVECNATKSTLKPQALNSKKAVKKNGLEIVKVTDKEVHLSQIVFLGPYLETPWDFYPNY